MRLQTVTIVVLLGGLVTLANTTQPVGAPADVIASFAKALEKEDLARARSFMVRASEQAQLPSDEELKRMRGDLKIIETKTLGDVGVVAVEENPGPHRRRRDYDPFYMMRTAEGWKLLPEVTDFTEPGNGLTAEQIKSFKPLAEWFERWKTGQHLIDEGKPADNKAIELALQAEQKNKWFNAASEPGKMKALLASGADIDARNEDGQTALHMTTNFRLSRGAVFLIEAGADVNAKSRATGGTALMLATVQGMEDVVALLIRKDAEVNAQDDFKRSALHMAAGLGHRRIVKLLLDAGADPWRRDDTGKTPLDWVRENRRNLKAEDVKGVMEMLEKASTRKSPEK